MPNDAKGKRSKRIPPFCGIKTKVGGFRKGHQCHTASETEKTETTAGVWLPRLDQDSFARVVQVTAGGLLTVPDSEGRPGSTKILRPRRDRCRDLTDKYLETDRHDAPACAEMRLLNVEKNAMMWNDCIQLHAEQSNGCTPRFSIANERKIGLAWQQSLHCVNCQFKSGMYKLYDEVPTGGRGQKLATTNVALQIGLQDSAISNTKMCYLLTSANVPPPSRRGMQKTANKVASITAQHTVDDLKQKREKIREVNSLRGHEHNAAINISTDVRYNSSSLKNSYGAGQSCSQAIATCIEWQTDRHDIIGFHLENKLCKLGSTLRNRGYDVSCPGHEGCTATIPVVDPISEYRMGREMGLSLAKDNVRVKFVATDGDALGSRGIQAGMPAIAIERQSDTTHLGETQFRHIMKTQFSPRMFPGDTAIIRAENKKMFAEDVKNRCQKVYTDMHTLYAGDIAVITNKMPRIIQATLDCYAGSCRNCRRHGIVCKGGTRNNWWHRSQHLKACGLHRVNMTDADRAALQQLIEMRLGAAALQLTKMRLTTNKNEAANRAISASLPKNVKFSRNAQGRLCSVIDRMNYGAGVSLLRKLESVHCPITPGGRVAQAAKQIQNEGEYQRAYRRRPSVKLHARYAKFRRVSNYFAAKRNRRQVNIYKKCQLDVTAARTKGKRQASKNVTAVKPVLKRRRRQRQTQQTHGEHTYSLRSLRQLDDHNYSDKE